jgi:hypothetical protein
MMTRKKQREACLRLAEERRVRLDDVAALARQFERSRPAPRQRARKEKKPRCRENRKISEFQMERILHLRHHEQLSYS